MIALLVAVWIQEESNFAKLFPKPTGLNGYEDYVRAGDLLGPMSNFREYESQIRRPGLVPGPKAAVETLGPDFYTAQLREVEAFPEVTAFVISGNQKNIQLPQELGPDALFPELSTFRMISRYQMHRAYIDFASGRADQGLDTLLTTFDFARNISLGIVISRLVGVACEAIVFVEVNQHLSKLSFDQLERLDIYAQSWLAAKPAGVAALDGELKLSQKDLEGIEPTDGAPGNTGDGEDDAMSKAWKAMNESERVALISKAANAVRDVTVQTANILSGSEPDWMPYYRTLAADSEPSILDVLVDAFGTKSTDGSLLRVEAIKRIQFHLLHLHCKVLEYRWTHGVLPTALADCVPSEETMDFISGKPFTYLRRGKGYTITSDGTEEIGRVALDQRKTFVANSEQGTAVP